MHQQTREIGIPPWSRQEMMASIPQFLELYDQRPLQDNKGGMKAPHMFATWFMLKSLKPTTVIESGVWKGQGTWLIENAVPNANVFSIDLNLSMREFISPKAMYLNQDFSKSDWSKIPDKTNTLLFFDDHQNALKRLIQGQSFGFKQFIFEDNYPAKQGDCYSLKKAFQHAGFNPPPTIRSWKTKLRHLVKPMESERVAPNATDANTLNETLEVYYEFPPVIKAEKTRWNDDWTAPDYPTPDPLFETGTGNRLKLFEEEAAFYTWICYARLK